MEILLLVLLYYLSQNPNFTQSVKPLMEQLKNSEQTLKFLNDLAKFNQTFQTGKTNDYSCNQEEKKDEKKREDFSQSNEKNANPSPSPTAGIADEFIQQILDGYLRKK
jgi:hypothetical protein